MRERAARDAPELRQAQLNAAIAAKQKPQQQQQKENDDWEMDKPGKKGKSGSKKSGSATTGVGSGATTGN